MNDFTASNGYVVSDTGLSIERPRIVILEPNGQNTLAVGYVSGNEYLDGDDMQALREFFRAEEDAHLGRWRWPENPDYVVYPNPGEAFGRMFGPGLDLVILRESDGMTKGYVREGDQGGPPMVHRVDHILAARAYFDAHPEPRPWHDAEIGEVWVMGPLDVAYTVVGGVDSGRWFARADVFGKAETRDLTHPAFTSGIRIWKPKAP